MFTYSYFKPSQVREGARQLFEEKSKQEREQCASALGVTVANLWTACRSKKDEEPETLRGIPGCVAILQHFGAQIEPVPLYRLRETIIKETVPLDVPPPNVPQ
jgi:hypothetical protein